MFKRYKIITIFIFSQINGMRLDNITLLPSMYALRILSLFDAAPNNKAPSVRIQNSYDCHLHFLVHLNTKFPWHINYFYINDHHMDYLPNEFVPQGIALNKQPNYKPELQSLVSAYTTIFSQLKNNWAYIKFNNETKCHEIGKSVNLLQEEHSLILFLLKKYNFNENEVQLRVQEEIEVDEKHISVRSKIKVLYLIIQKDAYSLFKEKLQFNIVT